MTQAEPTPRTEEEHFLKWVSDYIDLCRKYKAENRKYKAENSALRAENEALHITICQAVGLHNRGEPTGAAQILRQALIAYADAAMQEGQKS